MNPKPSTHSRYRASAIAAAGASEAFVSSAEVARVYDRMVADYDKIDEEAFYHNQYRAYRRHLDENRDRLRGHLLDIGCGTGLQVAICKPLVAEVTGVDISEGLLEEARRKLPDVHFINADACKLPFPDCSFDTVISYGEVFSHIPDYRVAFREAVRVLRPGGFFMFSVLNKWNIRTLLRPKELCLALRGREGHLRKWECVINSQGERVSLPLKTFGKHELLDLARDSGLEILDVRGLHILSLLVPLTLQYATMNFWGRCFVTLGKMDEALTMTRLLPHFGYTKLLVTQRKP